MNIDLRYQSVPLPEDVLKMKFFGDYAGAKKLIASLLEKRLPDALRKRLELEIYELDALSENQYPFSFDEAVGLLTDKLRGFGGAGELLTLKENGLADWIYVDGRPQFQRRFFQTLVKTRPEYAERLLEKDDEDPTARQKALNENIVQMKKKGGRASELRVRASVRIKKEFERIGQPVTVHLPIPREYRQVSDFKLISAGPVQPIVSPLDAPQRTVCFQTTLRGDDEFFVEYTFKNTLEYRELDPSKAKFSPLDFDRGEELPHIRFTPYLRCLLDEIIADEKNPVIKARRIYDFITKTVNYTYMREYFTVDNISEYAAVNLRGDCGVQAILYITLCRLAGIPARWQSGLLTAPYYTGPHDWAEYYIEPWGWIFADVSFGGSAWRSQETERWNYYASNLDVYRMPANCSIQDDFTPAKKHIRADPVDNQRGEIEYDDRGLSSSMMIPEHELISIKDI
jgi:transglutaminase-like putative cysteine protease